MLVVGEHLGLVVLLVLGFGALDRVGFLARQPVCLFVFGLVFTLGAFGLFCVGIGLLVVCCRWSVCFFELR